MGGKRVGTAGDERVLQLIAGLQCQPCEIMDMAKKAADGGMNVLRGDVYREGRWGGFSMDLGAMEKLAEAGYELDIPVIARIRSYGDMERAARLLDMIELNPADWKIGKHPQSSESLIVLRNEGSSGSWLESAEKLRTQRNGSGGLILCESIVLEPAQVGMNLEAGGVMKARESGLPVYVDISPCKNSDTAAYVGKTMCFDYGARGLLLNVYNGSGSVNNGHGGIHVGDVGKFVSSMGRYIDFM
jgi:3-deoxy-D-arabino-heptulosonate 7-phosphate (DAHP) synthase